MKLESARVILFKGACRLVGSKENILVWGEPWIPDLPFFLPIPCENIDTTQVMAVDQLMSLRKNGWNVDKLKDLFDDATVLAIKNIPRWSPSQEDSWVLLKITIGDFSIKSVYRKLNH
ncbi:dehydrodolichyl diphosphate synthase 2 [Fagus crenata]